MLELASRSLAAGGFSRPESHLSRRPAVLDEEGFAAASAVISEALDRISAIEQQSAERLREDDHAALRTVVVGMLFEAGEDGPGRDADGSGSHVRAPRPPGRRAARSPAS